MGRGGAVFLVFQLGIMGIIRGDGEENGEMGKKTATLQEMGMEEKRLYLCNVIGKQVPKPSAFLFT